ncbi:IclR family transcriptional regulator domain-containing protein [Aureimonas jatrophae]|uniref:Transcriptional regulator, IclR family n=1 Tax=Aureimonas jatrophae TaxID=1166073 RepID=A0A1H0F030_9HYPH|nr:IclR family transcriptional regulator C-terminal domain-containing protein [Aureimonas jatrophae]MBB3950236.1 IclR family pca regulon transcriptional regulator [Aureimonas jatrophae]SDN88027.1 transcriptional regulator, IclR family [Aureimonas jatrophae]
MANNRDHIESLAKGLRVLEAFGAERPRLSVSEAAAIAGLDRAGARRCLLTLHDLGYADYDGKYFSPTPRVLRLGLGALAALPLPQIVQPWLDQLSERIGQSTSVSVLDETEIVYLARAAQRRLMPVGLMPGSRLPAHCTSMGRVLLASLPEAEARALVERSDLSPRTPRSLTAPDEIMARVGEARRLGYAVIDQEVAMGLRALAVPLHSAHGRVVAALNTGFAAGDGHPDDAVAQTLPELLRVQDGLRRVLR